MHQVDEQTWANRAFQLTLALSTNKTLETVTWGSKYWSNYLTLKPRHLEALAVYIHGLHRDKVETLSGSGDSPEWRVALDWATVEAKTNAEEDVHMITFTLRNR